MEAQNVNKKPSIIGIIPARGGSKKLPRKNIKSLGGMPLIWHTINEAKKSKYLCRLIVSTEDNEIAGIAKKYEAEVVARPAELAEDDTPSRLVFQHVIKYMEEVEAFYPDIIVVLQPTSPCRLVEDIDKAIELFLETDCDSVVSVCETEHPPHWVFTIEGDRLKPILTNWNQVTRRQDAPETYRINGAVYVIRRAVIMEHDKGMMGCDIHPFVMLNERSLDIDSEFDFKLAELIIRKRGRTLR